MEFERLMQLPESSRDDRWELEFLDSVVSMKVEVIGGGEPMHGPDGWPYLRVRTGQGDEPFSKIVRWLAGRGIGLVVNSHKMAPDYVFTYGMLWNFVETGRFITPWVGPSPGQTVDLRGRVVGPPNEAYLPPYVRSILSEFLQGQKMGDAKVLVATTQDYAQTDLVFSLESLGKPDAAEQKTLAEILSWFLPLHYMLVFLPEADLKGWVYLRL